MKKIIIANWKMQLALKESLSLARSYVKLPFGKTDLVACPDYSALPFLGPIFQESKIILGAQDCAPAESGALTGEVAPANLKSLGAKYVIIGHSERRENLGESSPLVAKKITAAIAAGLIPVVCIGERLSEKKAGKTETFLKEELRASLKGVSLGRRGKILLAYEPVWAISSNSKAKALDPTSAGRLHEFIRQEAKKILKTAVPVLYGGSVNETNAQAFLVEKNIAGLLIGGASLDARRLVKIIS